MLHRFGLFALVLMFCATHAAATDAGAVFARYKEASGAAHWDAINSQKSTGTLAVGGLAGDFEAITDTRSGRSSSHYKLGSVEGAQGFDGSVGWSRDPGGEVTQLDAPEAKRSAATQAWLDAHGYWYPARLPAQIGKPESRERDGRSYEVIVATPRGGDPLTLWFDAQSHLLTLVEQKQGQDLATTRFDDWREVDGLRLPFHFTIDLSDSSGHVDSRNRTEARITRYVANAVISDADFAKPAMAATARIDNAAGITRVPFKLVNNHIYADGSINGMPARFLVDTGGANVLTPASAKKFALQGEGKMAGRGVGDEIVDVALAHAREVRLGDAMLANPVFYIMDLGDIPKVEGFASDGLVGYEMFRRFGITIDYANSELILAEPAKFTVPAGSKSIPFELASRIPIIAGELDGVPVRISVDTGSRVSLTLHSPFVREQVLVEKYHAAPDAVTGWGVGGPARGRPVRLGTLKLGDIEIHDIAGDLFTGEKGAFADPDVSGNLGGGVLKRFTVAFDYSAKRMYLAPNAAFARADAHDRSGLWLMGDDEALRVADVARESAAAAAGLRVDDRIVTINKQPVAARTLDAWRKFLRESPVATRLQIGYRRGSVEKSAMLVLADRIPPTFISSKP